jgi:chromosome partitioning protein
LPAYEIPPAKPGDLYFASSLTKLGKKVLLIDFDPQGSLTVGLGIHDTAALERTSASLLIDSINEQAKEPMQYINTSGSIPFIPGNIMLSSVEVQLVNVIDWEMALKEALELSAGAQINWYKYPI